MSESNAGAPATAEGATSDAAVTEGAGEVSPDTLGLEGEEGEEEEEEELLPLFAAVRLGDATALHTFVAQQQQQQQQGGDATGFDVNQVNESGQTALYWACEYADPAMARILTDAGADANQGELNGWTPLHLAAFLGHGVTCQFLLQVGAKVDKRNKQGSTPLHLAAQQGHVNVAQVLLAADADVLALDDAGATPIQYAEPNSDVHVYIREILLSMRSTSSRTKAATEGKILDAVKLLKDHLRKETANNVTLKAKLADTTAALEGARKSLQCILCSLRRREVVLLPCHHLHACRLCMVDVNACPHCGGAITGQVVCKMES